MSGSVHELLDAGSRNAEISLTDVPDELAKDLEGAAERSRRVGTSLVLEVIGDDNVRATLQKALAAGARVESVSPKRETLEDIFVRKAL